MEKININNPHTHIITDSNKIEKLRQIKYNDNDDLITVKEYNILRCKINEIIDKINE